MEIKFDIPEYHQLIKRLCSFRYINNALLVPGMAIMFYDRNEPAHKHASQHHYIFTDDSQEFYQQKYVLKVRYANAKISKFLKNLDTIRKEKKFKPKEALIEGFFCETTDNTFIRLEGSLPDGYTSREIISLVKYDTEESTVSNILVIMNRTKTLVDPDGVKSFFKFSEEDILRVYESTEPYLQIYDISIGENIVKFPMIRSYFYGLKGKTIPTEMFLLVQETLDPNIYLVSIEYRNKDIREGHIQLIGNW